MSKLRIFLFLIPLSLFLCACNNSKDSIQDVHGNVYKVKSDDFKGEVDGKTIEFYSISNKNGMEATFTNFGQRLISLIVPDKEGKFDDVVLGFPSLNQYLDSDEKYFGAVIGRYANRIAKGKFTIDGVEYKLAVNNGANHLHGGLKGFNDQVWKGKKIDDNEIEFTRISPDMEEGYPGNLDVKVIYELTDGNELKIYYTATTDKPTIVNLTHHSFFNLKGEGEGKINGHELMINADNYTPVDAGLIPTGEIEPVKGTPFDFRVLKPIGKDLLNGSAQLKMGGGYDHNFILNDAPKNEEGLVFAAKVVEPESGRIMEVYTNEPGLQFYGGNFLGGKTKGKSGKSYVYQGAFCLETQHFPDSPNQPDFPSTRLNPGDVYKSTCVYKFDVQ